MPGVLPFVDFVHAFGELPRAEFLERVTLPHLFFPNLPDLAQSKLFQTLEFKIKSPEADAEVEGNDDDTDRVKRNEVINHLGGQGIIPIQKADANAFSMMITLGRASNNDLIIPDKRVSKFHVYFRQMGSHWTVTDANSTNGTSLDDSVIPPERSRNINSGATLELSGAIKALFLMPEDLFALLQDLQYSF